LDVDSQDLLKANNFGGFRKEDSGDKSDGSETVDGNQSQDLLAADSSNTY
jgi:hypothetical protein